MPGLIDTFAIFVVAALAPTTVLGANLLYLGTVAAASISLCREAANMPLAGRP